MSLNEAPRNLRLVEALYTTAVHYSSGYTRLVRATFPSTEKERLSVRYCSWRTAPVQIRVDPSYVPPILLAILPTRHGVQNRRTVLVQRCLPTTYGIAQLFMIVILTVQWAIFSRATVRVTMIQYVYTARIILVYQVLYYSRYGSWSGVGGIFGHQKY